jgi:beta-D-xylosidase 4
LPLSQQGLKTIALIGPHANGTTALLGGQNYRGENLLIHSNTPLQRFRAHLQPQGVDVRYAEGCEVLGNDTSKIAAAVQQAKSADIVLLFLGTNGSIENEGIDRQSLELTGKQSQLATAVADAAAKPVIAILFNGGPLAIRELKDNPKVGGIVESFFPGQFGAEALFQLLFGQVSFSGALPVTIYDKDFISRRSIMDHDLRNNGGVTYLLRQLLLFTADQVMLDFCTVVTADQGMFVRAGTGTSQELHYGRSGGRYLMPTLNSPQTQAKCCTQQSVQLPAHRSAWRLRSRTLVKARGRLMSSCSDSSQAATPTKQ